MASEQKKERIEITDAMALRAGNAYLKKYEEVYDAYTCRCSSDCGQFPAHEAATRAALEAALNG